MPNALIVVGDDLDDAPTAAIRLLGHLHKRARLPWKRIESIYGSEAWSCREKVAAALLQEDVLLLWYIGHCSPVALAPADGLRIGNDELAEAVAMRTAPTLIVNGGCHSYALAHALEHAGADPKKVGLIAACGADGYSYGQVHEEVMIAWKQGAIYEPWVRLTIDTSRNGSWQEDDGETITCHIGNIGSAIVPQPECDQGRRWGTLELDQLFFSR